MRLEPGSPLHEFPATRTPLRFAQPFLGPPLSLLLTKSEPFRLLLLSLPFEVLRAL
ncbi:hypothetical protein SAMN05421829_101127 [Aromatoleum tolulyticum]|uniref:Uncharacterized protein n=1 Tax=Aromatoleum tolulyticum TaxID=34027 RepID=A0A1N6N6U4_9RHOO|nr:hypothetical protein SAMN05421829_101127 [Aromatoleum tolulyticum]